MHRRGNWKSTPKVVDGKVQRKNRTSGTSRGKLIVDRRSPARGCRHVVSKSDVLSFIDLIPDWERLSEGLERIVLSPGNNDYDGLYESFHQEGSGIIYLGAWNQDLWMPLYRSYFEEHAEILSQLGVTHSPQKPKEDTVDVRFTPGQAKAFVLLHIFLHELGHHYHQQQLRHRSSQLDEGYAESFANRRAGEIFPRYLEAFGNPALDS